MFDFASHQMHPVRRWATGDGSLTNTDVTGRHFLQAIDRSFQLIRRQQKSKWLIKEVTMFAEALIYSQNIFKIKYATKLTKLTTQRYKQARKETRETGTICDSSLAAELQSKIMRLFTHRSQNGGSFE